MKQILSILFINKTTFIISCFVPIVILINFYTNPYGRLQMIDEFTLPTVTQTLSASPHIFSTSPLNNLQSIHNEVQPIPNAAIASTQGIRSAYEAILNHPSWIPNRVLGNLIVVGQFTSMIIGAYVSCTYFSKKQTNLSFSKNIKNLFIYTASPLLLMILLSLFLGSISSYLSFLGVRESNEMIQVF